MHASLFIVDPKNRAVSNSSFAHLFEETSSTYDDARLQLEKYTVLQELLHIKLGLFSYLSRGPRNEAPFFASLNTKQAAIFLSIPYFRHQLEECSLLLAAANDTAKNTGKPALLKVPVSGTHFGVVDDQYGVKPKLYSHFLHAMKRLLEKNSYNHIKQIEFPVMNSQEADACRTIFGTFTPKDPELKITAVARDILAFTPQEVNAYSLCARIPNEAFALPGNDFIG